MCWFKLTTIWSTILLLSNCSLFFHLNVFILATDNCEGMLIEFLAVFTVDQAISHNVAFRSSVDYFISFLSLLFDLINLGISCHFECWSQVFLSSIELNIQIIRDNINVVLFEAVLLWIFQVIVLLDIHFFEVIILDADRGLNEAMLSWVLQVIVLLNHFIETIILDGNATLGESMLFGVL